MNSSLLYGLVTCETDVNGALKRFYGDEPLYVSCLNEFLTDSTMRELEQALAMQAWDDAFTAAHALKGLAGNMGFVPLFHATGELVVLIRAGKVNDVSAAYRKTKACYEEIIAVIRANDGAEI